MATTPVPDRRIQRTVENLTRALIDLSLDLGYDRVSARQVARKAGVSHSTFYRHFRDKDDLLMRVCVDALQECAATLSRARSPQEELVLAFKYVRANPDPVRLYISLPGKNLVRLMIRDMTAEMIHLRYQPQSQRSIPPHVAIRLFIAACNELMTWYLDNMDECSPERAATMFDEMIVQAITHSAFVHREEWLQRFS